MTKVLDFTDIELWKILDAIQAYKKDYAVAATVQKALASAEKKIKTSLKNGR